MIMQDPRWLTDEEQRAWRQFAAVVMQLPGALDAQLQQDAHITHFGYWVLAMLSERPDRSARMSELAALANGSQSRLSHLVARLEERGWIRRERAPDDGRGYVAVLTDEGYAKVVATAPGHVDKVRSVVFDALTPEQVAQLTKISAAILHRLSPDTDC
jgi:DNA-binding MarR family transcriptional regulator